MLVRQRQVPREHSRMRQYDRPRLLSREIRCNPSLFARLRSFAFNILKANRRSSLPQDRFRAAIGGLDYLLNLLRIPQR